MVSVLVFTATEIFFESLTCIKVQGIFHSTFKLIFVVGRVLYFIRQTFEHLDPRIVCSLLVR